jgi:hypothetical protein
LGTVLALPDVVHPVKKENDMKSPLTIWAGRGLRAFAGAVGSALLAGAVAPVAAVPLISEVFYDAVGSDNGQSFVELYGAPGTDLAGYLVEGINGSNGDVTHSLALSGLIGVDGLFVLADDVGDGTTLVADADQLANFDFQNGYQTQAKSGAYAVPLRRIGPGCATAQSCVC